MWNVNSEFHNEKKKKVLTTFFSANSDFSQNYEFLSCNSELCPKKLQLPFVFFGGRAYIYFCSSGLVLE